MGPVTATIVSDDPITVPGATLLLSRDPRVHVTAVDHGELAQVVVALTHRVGDPLLSRLRTALTTQAVPTPRVVLVAEEVSGERLATVTRWAPLTFLPRGSSSFADVIESVTRGLAAGAPGQAVGAGDGPDPGALLTHRDIEVLTLLADGLGTAEIARRFGCSPRTVKSVIRSVIRRLGLNSRGHAVAYALRAGLI